MANKQKQKGRVISVFSVDTNPVYSPVEVPTHVVTSAEFQDLFERTTHKDAALRINLDTMQGIREPETSGEASGARLSIVRTAEFSKSDVPLDKLSANLRTFIENLNEIVSGAMDRKVGGFRLDAIDVGVQITGEGHVGIPGLVGGKAGGQASLTLSFKRGSVQAALSS